MYHISEQQIEYILNDIRRNGVEMEDLQLNLLDHICCIIEQNLKEGDDFEDFYRATVKQFCKHELWEIEEETIILLTIKNYYVMKKSMIISGTISVAALLFGSFLKVMHWPGASAMLVLGIGILSFIFLPLMLLLKTKETNGIQNKTVIGVGTLLGILLCMSTLFKVMHWPGANMLWLLSIGCSMFIFIPLYFFTGIRHPETKMNTIVTTIILIGATGLLFTLTSLRKSKQLTALFMYDYLRNEQLLSIIQNKQDTSTLYIQNICQDIKKLILTDEIGLPYIPKDFEEKGLIIFEGGLGDEFNNNGKDEIGKGAKLLVDLKLAIEKYNLAGNKIPIDHTILDGKDGSIMLYSNLSVLNSLTQIQLFLATSKAQISNK